MNTRLFARILWLGLILLAACGQRVVVQTATIAPLPTAIPTETEPPPAGTITVMAAASLSAAFDALGAAFEAQFPGTDVVFNYAGSQQLAQQINQGAPADVFASANIRPMDAVIDGGRINLAAPVNFAANQMVIIVPAANPGGISGLPDLARSGVTVVLAAEEVPAGQYALELLDRASTGGLMPEGYRAAVLENVVSYEENVKAVVTKISLGEADAGIVYTTDSAAVSDGSILPLSIPEQINVTATYPIAALQDAPNPTLAKAFVNFILSEPGQAILQSYGFLPVP